MRYSNRIVELAVGAFLVLAMAALSMLAFQVSGLGRAHNGSSYTVYAYFNNISGLAKQAKVSAAGVVIGEVTNIQLDPATYKAKVTMAINDDVDYLSVDSIASVQTAGVLGEKYISISIGAEDEVLKDGSKIEDTESAFVLEELIGKFLTSMANKSDSNE